VPLASIPMAAVLLVATITVHLPYGFSSIKLQAVTTAGAQFGPPGFETDLLYLACLAALVLGGSGPLAIEGLLAKRRETTRLSSHAASSAGEPGQNRAIPRRDGVAPAAVGQRDVSSYCTVSAPGCRRSPHRKREQNEDGA